MSPKHQTSERSKALDRLVQSAMTTCQAAGATLTPLRESVLRALCEKTGPVGAYDLKDQISQTLSRPISPASIYRVLDFLVEHGVAARIESRNAYVACERPGHDHACVLFVCNGCGASSELEDSKLESLLAAGAKKLGFSIDHRVVELSGSCADCRGVGA